MKQYPFQQEGTEFLASRKLALLGDVPGLGKTNQAILALDELWATSILIICPGIAKINWLREFKMWAKLPRKFKILAKLADKPINGVNIMSFAYAEENFANLTRHTWDCIIVDEGHFLKNPEAKRSKAILGKHGLIHKATFFWLLTGTPAPNNISELWVYLYTFGATKLKKDEFTKRYCTTFQTGYGLKVTGNRKENIPELKSLLKTIMLRRLNDVVDLPEINYRFINVDPVKLVWEDLPGFAHYYWPDDNRQKFQDDLTRQAQLLTSVFTNIKRGSQRALQTVEALSDSVSTLRRYIGLQKVVPLADIINRGLKAKNWDKIVIFALHADVIEQLRQRLTKHNPVVIYGKTPMAKRQRRIDKFQNNEKCKVFIGNIHAAGTAITLTRACTVYFAECSWVPGDNAQAIMRVHRIGQERNVAVRYITLNNSIDSLVTHAVNKKTKDLMEVFDV